MVVSEVVGVGIFLSPATMTRALGSLPAVLGVWAAFGVLSAAGALCYAELATRYPRAGGAYVYLREAYGPRAAFAYGWMALLVVDPGIAAALGLGLSQYLLAALGASSTLTVPVALVCLVAFAGLTLAGTTVSGRVIQGTTTVKLVVVGVILAAGLWHAVTGAGPVPVSPGGGSVSAGALAAAVMAAFFAFGGWWDVGRMSEEVADPRRTMPRALLGGLALVTVIYALVSVSFVLVAGGAAGSSDDAFVSAVGAALFGASAGRLLAAMVAVTVTGSLAAVFLAAPRMYLAMARDGFIPGGDRWFEPDRGTSRRGTLLQTLLAGLLVAFGTFDQILGYFVPMAVLFLGLSAAAVLVLPRPPADAEAFRAPLHPLPIVLFLALVLAVLVLVVVGQPMQALGGALVVALGVAASYVRPPGRSPSVAHRSSDA